MDKSKLLNKKYKLIINDEEKNVFIGQVFRKDILANMLANTNLSGKELYNIIMSDINSSPSDSRRGDLYETLCEILLITKCIENINYINIMSGDLSSLKEVKTIKTLLCKKIHQGGNVSDISIKNGNIITCFSIKYKKKVSKKGTDITDLNSTLEKYTNDYKIGLFVKSKEEISGSKKNDIHKEIFDIVIKNGLLFDEKDVIKALSVFCERFSSNVLDIDDFIDFINAEYLLSPRQQLTKKLHQKMTETKFINSFLTNKHKMWCIAHKPRSGKSITILLICKYLLEHDYKKILIMTSVPATINSFINDLEKYIDFKNINYKLQDDFDIIDKTFNGIVFCSTEYLKINKIKKIQYLKNINFEAIITDEAHLGGSTDKTKTEILDVSNDLEEIRKNKLNIFASGTADKTKKYYGIHSSCIYEWEIEDEAFMKNLIKLDIKNEERKDIINYMVNRHGKIFTECLENETLNKNYSKHPTPVLMKHSIPEEVIKNINNYNAKYGTNFGYNCASLFALYKNKKKEPEKDKSGNIIKTKDGEPFYDYEYTEKFELEKTSEGKDILIWFFDSIISNNKMKGKNNSEFKTIMTEIEETQIANKSRQSKKGTPLLFIIYLPTNTRNNTISLLQKTIKEFIKENELWSDYNIEYSNSIEDTGNVKEEYNEYIQTIMNKTKKDNKKGCILLLGNKGSVGITYKDCDVTISLDDGQNLDNQKQRFSRALTEAEGKTIGINVDMNIQRTYMIMNDTIQKHRRNTKTTKTNAEILYYLYEQNIFLFDPQEINNGKIKTTEIKSYYEKEAGNIMKEIDDTPFLESIICDDDMRNFIKIDFQKREFKKNNKDLEGEQQDCPKGDKTKINIDAPNNVNTEKNDENKLNGEETVKIECLINQTYEMCKSFLFPLLALISMSYKVFDFKEIFTNEKTKNLIISLLKEKKIEVDKDNYIIIINIMNIIIDNNVEIVNNIREIYSIAPANKLRELIEKHFIPTNDEKKKNAEFPTPVKLVDDMLNLISVEFWRTPKKVFEPCCGKGNFVLGIFDRFYKGLKEIYPDEIERCRIIMTHCIYYADLTALNVFITTEIMKCHIQSYCGLDEVDFDFNYNQGNTLELDIKEKWGIDGFDAVIGNPPYQGTGRKKLYINFIVNSLNNLYQNGILLFITPQLAINFIIGNEISQQKIDKLYDIKYINVSDNIKNIHFKNVGSDFAYYYLIKNKYNNQTDIVYKNNKQDKININFNSIISFDNSIHNILINKLINTTNNEWGRKAARIDKNLKINIEGEYVNKIVYKIKTNEIEYRYTNKTHNDFNKYKVLYPTLGNNYIVDTDRNLFPGTSFVVYIPCSNLKECNNILKLKDSNIFKYLINNFKNQRSPIDYIWRNLVKPSDFDIDIKNENDIYEYFNLTKEDINFIESSI